MRKNFNNAQNNVPAVTFYDGDVVMDNGEARLEWFDPIEGFSLQSEDQLAKKKMTAVQNSTRMVIKLRGFASVISITARNVALIKYRVINCRPT